MPSVSYYPEDPDLGVENPQIVQAVCEVPGLGFEALRVLVERWLPDGLAIGRICDASIVNGGLTYGDLIGLQFVPGDPRGVARMASLVEAGNRSCVVAEILDLDAWERWIADRFDPNRAEWAAFAKRVREDKADLHLAAIAVSAQAAEEITDDFAAMQSAGELGEFEWVVRR